LKIESAAEDLQNAWREAHRDSCKKQLNNRQTANIALEQRAGIITNRYLSYSLITE